METEIFKLIINSGGMALVLAILFFYSFKMFNFSTSEKKELKMELSELQKEFHSFKNDMINRLIDLTAQTKISIDNLKDSIEAKFK